MFFIAPFIETASAAEDFTTYTRVNDGQFTTTSSKITGTTVYLNDACKIYKDYGAVITDFYCTFTFNRSAKGSNSNMGGFAMSSTLSTWFEALANNYNTILVTYDVNSAGTLYRVMMTDSSNDNYDETANINVPFTKYMNFSRSGTTATLKIYNDASMTDLYDTLTITCNAASWRYVYGHLSYGYTSAGAAQTGYIENLVTYYTSSTNPIKTDIGTGYSSNTGHTICRTSDGTLHCVYRDGSNVQYRSSINDGATWSSTTQLLTGNYYPAIACDSQDNLHVIIATTTNQKVYYLKRWASNNTWSTALDRGYGAVNQYYPGIVVDAADNIHISWYRTGDYAMYRFYNAATSTWGAATQASTGTGACPDIFVAPNGYVYHIWYTGNYFNFRYWDGTVWSAVKTYTFGATPHGESQIVVDKNNRIHVATRYASTISALQICYAASDDYGTTWINVNSAMSARTGYQYNPTLSIDAEGTIHLMWQGYSVGGSYYAVQYRNSTNGGVTWSTQTALASYTSHQHTVSQIHANYPIINGVRTNEMTRGYAFTWNNDTGTRIQYCKNGAFPSQENPWYDYQWAYGKKITIDHTKVASALSNFPILVSTTDLDFTKAQADGDDFIFVTADNKSKYNHEIEKWNSSTGELVAWVNITSLSSTEDTILYIYYGNPSCSNQQNVASTWDASYKAVWHMNDATTSTIGDSSSNAKTGTKAGANNPVQATGKIGYGQDFDGSDDYISAGASNGFISGADAIMTVEAWAKPDTISSGDGTQRIITFNGNSAGTKYTLTFGSDDNIQTYVGTEPPNWLTFTSTVSTGSYYFIVDACNGTSWAHYLNGKSDGTSAWGHSAFGTYSAYIGDLAGSSNKRIMDGIIDELRISNIERNAAWINTTYNTINSPSTFLTFGDEQTSWYTSIWTYSKKITIDHTKVASALSNFPVLVSTTDLDLTKAQADGDDFIFLSSDNTTKYNHEIESWNNAKGELIAWVNVTSLSSTTDTILYLYYGNSHCGNQQNAPGTWDSNYVSVWHMNDWNSNTLKDSTGRGHTLTKPSSNIPLQSNGKIQSSQEFDGTTSYARTQDHDDYTMTGALTVECWAEPDNADRDEWMWAIHDNVYPGEAYRLGKSDTSSGRWFWTITMAASGKDVLSNSAPSANTWSHIVGIREADGDMYMYVNGAVQTATTNGAGTINPNTNGHAGCYNAASGYFDGEIDELRISNIERSADWITTGYNNQNSPSAFLTIDDEQPVSYQSDAETWSYRQKITINHNKIDYPIYKFPLLIKTTMNTSRVQNDADDIFFTSYDGIKIKHEIENYNSTSGILLSWVNIPSITSLTPETYLYLYYGNQTCESQQQETDVWSDNYAAVWHLNQASASTQLDSTINNRHLTTVGSTPQQVTAKVGKGQSFDGTDDYYRRASGEVGITNIMTMEGVVYFNSVSSNYPLFGVDAPNPYNNAIWMNILTSYSGIFEGRLRRTDGSGYIKDYGWAGPSATTWYHVSMTWDGTTLRFYKNGVEITASNKFTDLSYLQTNTERVIGVGNLPYLSSAMLNGILDEIRFSNTPRSSSHISATYRNIFDPANFTTFGSEEEYQGPTGEGNTAPNTPTSLGPTARQTSTSVNIYATGSDPDGGSLYLYFYNDADDVEIGHTSISNNTQGQVSWSSLTRGNTYTFYTRAYDGSLWGSNSSTCQFTINSLPVCTGFMIENLTDPTRISTLIPYFNWTYSDADSDTQVKYEIDVGTTNNSNNVWDPTESTSANHYAIYAGSTLSRGQLYYVRVRVYDGYEWSSW